MESRMEKYYRDNTRIPERSKKNSELYKNISKQMSDLDNLPIPDNSNEIDVNGLKRIISSRDEYRKKKNINRNTAEEIITEDEEKKNDKVYDINVLLETAKKEITKRNDFEHEKKNNFLVQLEDANIPNNDDAIELATPTLENSNSNNKSNNISNTDSLPLDILVDLKGKDNTIVTDPIVKNEVTMIKKIKDGETFYSGSYNFSKKDFFDDDLDDDFMKKKSHTGVKVFFLIIGLLILIASIYFILTTYVL